MASQELWGIFEKTGSVKAYLEYIASTKEPVVSRNADTVWDGTEEISATVNESEEVPPGYI